MSTRYIGTGGRITRRSGVKLRDFSALRLSILLVLCTLLFVSNPANEHLFSSLQVPLPGISKPISSSLGRSKYNLEFFGIEINISLPTIKCGTTSSNYNKLTHGTNYHLFSLSRDMSGVDIGVLFKTIPICSYDGRTPNLCIWVSNNMCHRYKIFDPNNKAFTVLRIVQILKIVSFLLQQCYTYNAPLFPKIDLKAVQRSPLTLFFSVFYETNSVRDFVSFTFFLFPALTLLERITTIRDFVESTVAFHYYWVLFAVTFIITIGAISNLLAAYFLNDKAGGMKGTIAASLGFIAAVKPYDIVLDLLDVKLTAGEALFTTFAVTFVSSLLGFDAITEGEWEISNIMSWAFGGLLGFVMGEYQKDRLSPWLIYFFA